VAEEMMIFEAFRIDLVHSPSSVSVIIPEREQKNIIATSSYLSILK
jgi:hypothetical protein